MISQRVVYHADGSADLTVHAEPIALAELVGLAEELNLRSTVRTESPIHHLNDPQGNAATPSIPPRG
jgi:hypothetical protein